MNKKILSILSLLSLFVFPQVVDEQIQKILEDKQLSNSEKTNIEIEGEDKSVDSEENLQANLSIDQRSESEIFGIDYIRSVPQSITATSDLPVSSDYLISIGDKLRVLLTGGKEDTYVLQVLMDGTILFPEIGSINVFGEPINNIRETISKLVKLSYVGTEVVVSLESLAAKKINIIGAVKNPGTYIVSPFSTIMSSLSYSGGFEDYASLREIIVIRKNEKIIFDLYDFLVFGLNEKDINLQQGDTILVQSTNRFVNVSGAVNRPKIYEYKKGDNYIDLVHFALGAKKDGDLNNISANVSMGEQMITKKVNKNLIIGDEIIDSLFVGSSVLVNKKDIFISGEEVTSGFYAADNSEMAKFLEKIKFSDEVYPFYANYENDTLNGLVRVNFSFALSDPATYQDLKALNNTRIHFFGRDDFNISTEDNLEPEQEKQDIEKPKADDLIFLSFPDKQLRVPAEGRISPKQLHLFFGSNSEINFEKVSAVTGSDSFVGVYDRLFDSDEVKAFTFPPKKESIITVAINGEVMNPGSYDVPSSTTINDLFKLAGGLKDTAFDSGVQLYREAVKERQIKAIKEAKTSLTESIIQKASNTDRGSMIDISALIQLAEGIEPNGRIAGNFRYDSVESTSTFLEDGDSIFIPTLTNEIVVQGEVLNSSSFFYKESYSYLDYIEIAGGFSKYADRRAIFIIKSDGFAIPVGGSLFSNDVGIEPGDTIVVPRNLERLETIPAISLATKIISDIAFSAASLNAIKN